MHKSKIQKHTSLENCIAKKRMFLENAKSPWFFRFEIMNEKNVFSKNNQWHVEMIENHKNEP